MKFLAALVIAAMGASAPRAEMTAPPLPPTTRASASDQSRAQRLLDQLKAQLGDGYRYEIDAEDHWIFAVHLDAASLFALRDDLRIQRNSEQKLLFTHPPIGWLCVVLPSETDSKTLLSRPDVGGIYNDAHHVLIARQMGRIVRHEFTHALHFADQDARKQAHPVWLEEGLASIFESAKVVEGSLQPRDDHRLALAQIAARNKSLIPLAQLLAMNQEQFLRRAPLSYGQAASLLMYLYDHQLLRRFYQVYTADYATDPTGAAALEQVTGVTLEDLDTLWMRWMLARHAPPMNIGIGGATLGLTLADANDGLRVAVVRPGSAAGQAGARAGDVIIGVDGVETRDSEALIDMLAAHRPGDAISLRFRRDQTYLSRDVTLGTQ